MAKRAEASPEDSVHSVLFGFFNLIRIGGFRVLEYVQKTQTKIKEFKYASGNKVVKAFIPSDCRFYDASGRLMTVHSLNCLAEVKKLRITFRIQKNARIVKRSPSLLTTGISYLPSLVGISDFLRATRLGRSHNQPIGVYLTTKV